jgi:hypothetical protein
LKPVLQRRCEAQVTGAVPGGVAWSPFHPGSGLLEPLPKPERLTCGPDFGRQRVHATIPVSAHRR